MRLCVLVDGMLLAILVVAAGCARLPGKPAPGAEVPRPDAVLDPIALYRSNCAACHGMDGTHGPAMALSDPVYLGIVDDDTLRSTIANGRSDTAMSAFAQKQGGTLTDDQIGAIVRGIRERWGGSAHSGSTPPPYKATATGNVERGAAVYETFCASCHGSGGQAGPKAGSVTEPAYLSLISDQGLRTLVITGRPDFGAPDWRGNVPGRPMTDREVSDVVAWLSSQRPAPAGESDAANSFAGAGR